MKRIDALKLLKVGKRYRFRNVRTKVEYMVTGTITHIDKDYPFPYITITDISDYHYPPIGEVTPSKMTFSTNRIRSVEECQAE